MLDLHCLFSSALSNGCGPDLLRFSTAKLCEGFLGDLVTSEAAPKLAWFMSVFRCLLMGSFRVTERLRSSAGVWCAAGRFEGRGSLHCSKRGEERDQIRKSIRGEGRFAARAVLRFSIQEKCRRVRVMILKDLVCLPKSRCFCTFARLFAARLPARYRFVLGTCGESLYTCGGMLFYAGRRLTVWLRTS